MVNFIYGNATTGRQCTDRAAQGPCWASFAKSRSPRLANELAALNDRFVEKTKHHVGITLNWNPDRWKRSISRVVSTQKAVEKYQNRFIWIWNFKIFIPKLKSLNFTAFCPICRFCRLFSKTSKHWNPNTFKHTRILVARWKNQKIFYWWSIDAQKQCDLSMDL